MKEKFSTLLKVSFVALLSLLFTCGFAKAVLFPVEISLYEQRALNLMPAFDMEDYLSGSMQTDRDAALGDQIQFSSYYKKLYNEFMAIVDRFFEQMRSETRDRYICCRGEHFFNGHMVDKYEPLAEVRDELTVTVERLNEIQSMLPETEFYLYYVNNDTDVDFATGDKSGVYDYLAENLRFGEENCGKFSFDSFEEYEQYFYYSDHHWNHEGSYLAYTQLAQMLGHEKEMLEPVDLVEVPGIFHGSRTLRVGAQDSFDIMQAYIFEYPPMEVRVPDGSLTRYGDLDVLLERNPSEVSYVGVYGDNMGYMQLSTGNAEKDNILVIGDSYDNALLKLLASHYNTTHSIDLRYYSYFMTEPFVFTEYVKENNISSVLLVGSRINFLELAKLEQW